MPTIEKVTTTVASSAVQSYERTLSELSRALFGDFAGPVGRPGLFLHSRYEAR
jgi:hypothetical protein